MKKLTQLTLLLILIFLNSCGKKEVNSDAIKMTNWNNEVIYHVMPRSFYDSNGDLHGDLNGFVEKLDYLKELGVTTILFTPLYESGFYHNYFPTNYENIDQEYGTKEDYINFVKAVHAKGMKFLMDMETQYAQSGNIWFDDSYQNPESEYSDFIYYTDSLNQYPEQIFMKSKSPLYEFTAWPGDKYNIVFLDLNNERVKQWMIDFYAYWVDPNQDGNFDDGVDGFRIDHIMDDLDYKGLFTNMYQEFWKPIFEECQRINPNVFVLGEQSNWNEYGDEMVKKSGATAAFNFPLKFAISGEEGTHDMYADFSKNSVSMNPDRIHDVVKKSLEKFSDSIYLVNFIENHDTNRWATLVQENEGQLRVAASLNLLLPGVPSIYYGQELGVTGYTREWGSDANHIPVREAFPWTEFYNDKGTAVWYKDTGEWWDFSFWNTQATKRLALSNQKKDAESLWNYYKNLLKARKDSDALRLGNYEPIPTDNKEIIGFTRTFEDQSVLVLINLSDKEQTISEIDLSQWNSTPTFKYEGSLQKERIQLNSYGTLILKK